MDDYPLVSIVIPTRNEGIDIGRTLDACLAITYGRKQIIVVDDSTDSTPEIVRKYADQGVQLLHRERNDNGCCGARNAGMRASEGDIIVIMNADALPAPDFIDRILAHYRDGADYVIVRSRVANCDDLWGRYIAAQEDAFFSSDQVLEWSEGFSCRRASAEAVGYIPGDFPVRFCRDWLLGDTLHRAGYKKHVDLSVDMHHIVASDRRGFWNNRHWRGTFSSPYAFYFNHMPLSLIVCREMLKAGRTLLRYVLVIPVFWQAVSLSRYSPRRLHDLPEFFYVGLIENIALVSGNFKGLHTLIRFEKLQTQVDRNP